MGIGEILTSVLGGGITGILGAVVTRIADYKNKKLDLEANKEKYAHEIRLREADAKIMEQEWAARTKVAEVEATGKEAVADAQAFNTALTSEPQRYYEAKKYTPGQAWGLIVLDIARGIVRPALTVYLCAITTIVYMEARQLLGDGSTIPVTETVALVKLIISTVLYLTTTCVLFWFGTRNKQSAPKVG